MTLKLVISGKWLAAGCFECTGVQTLSVPVQGLCCSLFLYSLESSTLLLFVDLVCLQCCFRVVQEEMVRLCLILPLLSLASDCPADSSEGTGEGSCGCSTSRNAGNQNETHQSPGQAASTWLIAAQTIPTQAHQHQRHQVRSISLGRRQRPFTEPTGC